ISASSHTAPSHTSIFTSFYPSQHGVLRNGRHLQEGLPTLASIMHEAGFETVGVTSVRFLKGISAGFDTFLAPHLGRGYRNGDQTVDVAIDWFGTRTERRRFLLWVHLYDVHHSDPSAATKPTLASDLAFMRQDALERGESLSVYLASEHGTSEELLRDDLDQINRYDAQIRFVDSQLERLFDRVTAATEGESTKRIWAS
ncbi:MAG: sulfatase-like hydrolase/transferase, partial [Acidobacteriota bacterium]